MKKMLKKIGFGLTILAVFASPYSVSFEQEVGIKIHENNTYAQEETQTVDASGFMECSTWDFACKGINFLQIIFVTGGNVIVGLAAFFMDTFLFHSLQSSSYRDSGFIVQGWEILRDLTNIIFIFALVTLAFQMVLDLTTANVKKRLIRVIIIALTINFSLFFSFAIIDMSNILAYTFYNKIEQNEVTFNASTEGDGTTQAINSQEEFKGKSTSLAIAAKINPQRLLSSDVVPNPTKGQRVVMVIMAGVINGVLIYVFLSVSFLFLGRTIGLWFSTILAPLAFASLTVPGLEKKKYFGFDNWFKSLIETAFMAPVFLFFLYLAVQFMKVDIGSSLQTQGAFIQNLLNIIIPMAAIVVLLLTAKKVANAMSGDFAGAVSGVVAKVAGGAVAAGAIVATGGAAAAGGALRGAGMAAKAMGKEGTASSLQKYGKLAQATNFNFAQSRVGKFASKTTGIDMGERLGELSYARADTQVRTGANKVREFGSNFTSGKTPESIKKWDEGVQASRDELIKTRIENVQRTGNYESKTIDPETGETKIVKAKENSQKLQENEAKLKELNIQKGRQTSAEAKQEADTIKEKKQEKQVVIDNTQDEIRNTNRQIQETQKEIEQFKKTGNSGAVLGAEAQITKFQDEINKKRKFIAETKEAIDDIEKTSIDGQISQVKKQIDGIKNDARANLLKADKENRNLTQDSSLTPNSNILGKSREERVDDIASRVGSGEIDTKPNINKSTSKTTSGTNKSNNKK
jgi:hypothetical protein